MPSLSEAQERLARHYLNIARTASSLFQEGSVGPGLALFDLEWTHIQAGQAWAAGRAGENAEAMRLCSDFPSAGSFSRLVTYSI